MSDYARVIIQGELRCLSDLHLGSGNQDGNDNEIVLDANGKPCIPASSLRGYLSDHLVGAGCRQTLFGDTGQMGALRVYDARLPEGTGWKQTRRTRIEVDAVTRTAADKKLFSDILVPRGTCFQMRLELDGIDRAALQALLDTLATLNPDNPLARLGQGKSHGRGRMQWNKGEVKVLDNAAFAAWIETEDQPLDKAGWESFDYKETVVPGVESWQLDFCFDEAVLINDPSIVKPKEHRNDDEPDMRCMRTTNDRLLVPGSSIKGLFRARARRILFTMGASDTRAEELLATLFGSTDGMGVLLWYDAESDTQAEWHDQTLIAVDRFTGGVQQSAMLVLEAARISRATGAVAFRSPLNHWQRALWLLLIRDAMEGDLALGWGQARGFGGFHLTLTVDDKNYNRFEIWRDQRERAEWETDFQALETALNEEPEQEADQ